MVRSWCTAFLLNSGPCQRPETPGPLRMRGRHVFPCAGEALLHWWFEIVLSSLGFVREGVLQNGVRMCRVEDQFELNQIQFWEVVDKAWGDSKTDIFVA